MEYITCREAHELWGITERRIQQMCKNGAIEGAIKKGGSWLIPTDAVKPSVDSKGFIRQKKKPLPIGVSDFKKAVSDYYYVDKTLLIRDFIDNKSEVTLFTRPRRFGKTLNMDMLRVFFEKTKEDNSVYFKDKLIWQCGEEYTSYQGKFPVIFLSFKDVKCDSWQKTFDKISKLITLEFIRHGELEKSKNLSVYEKELFVRFARGEADEVDYQMSLQYLSIMLNKHYNEKVIIIIDEYDTPIQQGHSCGFYDNIIEFMRGFFSSGLKDGSNLAYGFLTGILRVAKESIFSGLNNIKICSILDKEYSEYFGFTKAEVKELLEYYNASSKYDEVCRWYDGYLFGDTEIFNPWSVINYVSDKCEAKAFWQSTGSNDIIGEIIGSATPDVIENLHKLLNGEKVTTYIDTNVIYPEIQKNPYSIYSFLLIAGYLKVSAIYSSDMANMYDVSIPNKEISFVYEKEVLDKGDYNSIAIAIGQAIFKKDAVSLQKTLENFMLNTISFYDAGSESFYHGMVLGLCAVLSNRYHVKSNGEAGYGRFDIQLMPKAHSVPGFIFEFKHAKTDSEDLESLADEALRQIDLKKYDVSMKAVGVSDIVKIGIAFRGKKAVVKSR
ncbi:MAG: hypothetical protein E7614_08910 [Ruminococcaceae bacterium]|nr:hypothetical protein [Oscillospiraceae bacterium]